MILDHIWRSLQSEPTISAIDVKDISVGVDNGQVCLSGHVSQDCDIQQIDEITRSIPGVIAVHNHLVTDYDLNSQVTQALGENECTRLFRLPISCHQGWVEVGGFVPTREIQCAAEATAASVPTVRGVIQLPNIVGEENSLAQDAVQPRIGVRMFGKNETQGLVYQVVINPQNRLVTHAIVRVNHNAITWQEVHDYVVPVEVMDVVDLGGIFLNSIAPAIHQFADFTAADYPFAPLTWQPPHPYAVGSVRWPRLERLKA
ncbi:MAG TPA: BON domain-containing protein [Longilinea sp.]|nr:BON domain-containing protein [Longilinea sp.]